MSFRAALGAISGAPGASPWKNIRNWNSRVGPGSLGLARGQVGAKRAKIEGPGPARLVLDLPTICFIIDIYLRLKKRARDTS